MVPRRKGVMIFLGISVMIQMRMQRRKLAAREHNRDLEALYPECSSRIIMKCCRRLRQQAKGQLSQSQPKQVVCLGGGHSETLVSQSSYAANNCVTTLR